MRTPAPLVAGIALLLIALIATGALLDLSPERLFQSEPVDTAQPLAARIPAGQLATTLRFGQVESVGGTVRAGDTVDLYALYPERTDGGATTRVLMREKMVYASSKSPDATFITLAMPTDESLRLQSALLAGARPYAVLRSGRGMKGPVAPDSFDDSSIPSWITQVTESR